MIHSIKYVVLKSDVCLVGDNANKGIKGIISYRAIVKKTINS